jgi:hypothetical protein
MRDFEFRHELCLLRFSLTAVERCKSRTVDNETWKQWIRRAFQAGSVDLPEE